MGTTWIPRLAVVLAGASMAMACGGNSSDPAADDRGGGAPQVSLSGCVEAAPGTDQYVLRNVRLAPSPQQPSGAQTRPDGVITEGAWVKLRVDNDETKLGEHVGQMVSVTGTITDTGRDTIGTAGEAHSPDQPEPRTDASRAAADEHYSERVAKEAGPIGQQSLVNSTAPAMAVQRVEPSGQRCPGR